MRWEIWKPKYEEIAERLGLEVDADAESARVLNNLLPEPELDKLMSIVWGKECIVFGAAPSLEDDLRELRKRGFLKKVLISADGATSAVMKYRRPEIVVTDLDGKISDQLKAWSRGSWLVVHAHGNNLHRVKEVVPRIRTRIVGTTQTRPFGKLFNFGGFTDGDRATFLAHELGASLIYLAGMNPEGEIGKYSGRKNPARKRLKLQICREMLEWLKELGARVVEFSPSLIK